MSKRHRIVLHTLVAGLIILSAALSDYALGKHDDCGLIEWAGIATALVIIAIGVFIRSGVVAEASTNVCVFLISLIICVWLMEVLFRVIGFDFANKEEVWRKTPPYYRKPMVPIPDVFFRRSGPQQWTGKVLKTHMDQLGMKPNPYENEQAITVRYDSQGFRNPEDLTDWDVIVVGDSFTELGHLPEDKLFTTIIAEALQVKVKNLGTSYTGPLTYLSYVNEYGISLSTKHAIIAFFEGNDIIDLVREYEAIMEWKNSGIRNYRRFGEQTSMMKALYSIMTRHSHQLQDANAVFESAKGEVPIKLTYIPLSSSKMSAATLKALDYFFDEYANLAKTNKLTPWLAYLPCKRRVLHGQIKFLDGASEKLREWQPTNDDLLNLLRQLSSEHGIEFIDLTPPLIQHTGTERELLFNPIYDTHLNSKGAVLVGQEIANQLKLWASRHMCEGEHGLKLRKQ